MEKALAHYSLSKIFIPAVVTCAVGFAIFYFTISFDDGHLLKYAEAGRRYWLPFLFIAWVCGAVALVSVIVLIKRLLVDNSLALWIERDKLIFFHRWAFSVRCEDILEAIGNEHGKIVLRMQNGLEKEVPTSTLTESTEAVLSHLKAELRRWSREG